MKTVGIIDIKQALHDDRFCNLFPELQHEIDRIKKQPSCGSCSIPLAHTILNTYSDRVEKYFPNRKVIKPKDEAKTMSENNWSVINCSVHELENELKKLPPGRIQLAIARYEDQVTVVINELAVVF